MRTDLAKLTTERERSGSANPSLKTSLSIKHIPDEDEEYEDIRTGYVSSSRRRQFGYNAKEFTDRLNPIIGTLRKNCGRPWDKVYSELTQVLDRRSNSGIHIFGHLLDYVERNTFIRDGKVWYTGYSGDYPIVSDKYSRKNFYVHPKTGILTRFPQYRRPKTKVMSAELLLLEDGFCYEKIDGVWYHGKRVSRSEYWKAPLGTYNGDEVNWYLKKKGFSRTTSYFGSTWDYVLISKRTVGKREINKIEGLMNGK